MGLQRERGGDGFHEIARLSAGRIAVGQHVPQRANQRRPIFFKQIGSSVD
jgi:hypothetical protein